MSVSKSSTSELEQIWDYFFKAETGTYEKSQWLDLLLAEFLIQLKDGIDLTSIDSLCPIGGIATLVGCELLCGIHSASSTYGRFSSGDDKTNNFNGTLSNLRKLKISDNQFTDDLKIHIPLLEQPANFQNLHVSNNYIEKYILKGSAWRCLALLQILGIESLSCSRQLSGVLIWLYTEQIGTALTSHESNPYLPSFQRDFYTQEVFTNKIWMQKKKHFIDLRQISKSRIKRKEKNKSNQNDAIIKINKKSHISHSLKLSKIVSISKSQSSDSISESFSECAKPLFAFKSLHKPLNFEYLSRDIHNEMTISSKASSESTKILAKNIKSVSDFSTDRHKEVLNSAINSFEFKQLVIGLLIKLCKTENDLSGLDGLHINSQCVDFAIKNLCMLQFESSGSTTTNLDSSQIAKLKALLSELLLVTLNKVLLHHELSIKLINSGTLPMLLRLLEDLMYKLNTNLNDKAEFNENFSVKNEKSVRNNEYSNILTFLFAISYSIIAFLYSFLMHNHSLENLNHFIQQYKLFSECQNGLLVANSIRLLMKIPYIEKGDVIISIKGLINIIGKLVIAMKNIRTEYVHTLLCSRRKHKLCYSKIDLNRHHHHDIFGTKYLSENNMKLSPVCSIATFYGNFISLLDNQCFETYPTICYEILKSMRSCGTCCCFSPKLILEKIVEVIFCTQNLTNLCFLILEKTLYGEILSSEHDCTKCDNCNTLHTNQNEYYKYSETNLILNFLTKYNTLFKIKNFTVIYATMKHLLKIFNSSNIHVKHDLLFTVIYPVLEFAKNQYISTNTEISFFIISSCLNVYSNLLCFLPFSEEFIRIDGLAIILELIAYPEFYQSCSSVLETIVDTEIFNIQYHRLQNLECTLETNKNDVEQIDMLLSVETFFSLLEKFSQKAFKYFMIKMDENLFKDLIDLTRYQHILVFEICKMKSDSKITDNGINVNKDNPKKSQPINIKNSGVSHENSRMQIEYFTIEDGLDNYLEMIKSVSIFWKTCSTLCLYCPLLRQYIIYKKIFKDSYQLLKLILHGIFYISSTSSETALLIKVLESVLTVGLAVSDSTMDTSRKLVVKLLSEVLLSPKPHAINSQNMQVLLEMLIKVSSVFTSDRHVLRPFIKCKLAPLYLHKNSGVFSSSEDDDVLKSIEYLSDASDFYPTTDEGYEADLEIGTDENEYDKKNNINIATRRTSIKNGDDIFVKMVENLDYSISRSNNLVKFPEICVMVLDVLLKLTEKFLVIENNKRDDFSQPLYKVVCLCFNNIATVKFVNEHSSNNSMITQILTNPAVALLKSNSPKLEELQCAILNFIYTLASHSISPLELKLYLNLFTAESISLNNLLQPLLKLSENIYANVPDHILCFPTSKAIRTDSTFNDQIVWPLVHNHSIEDSCWSKASACITISDIDWGLMTNGCSIATWLRIQEFQQNIDKYSESCKNNNNYTTLTNKNSTLHVLSIGHETLMVEFWIDTTRGDISIRITNSTIDRCSVLGEIRLDTFFPLNIWTNLAVNISQQKRKCIEISAFINGVEQTPVVIPIKGIGIRKPNSEYLLLGHSVAGDNCSQHGLLYLSNVTLYKASIINKYNAVYLYANGPNKSSFTICQVGSFKTNYASVNANSLLSEDDWNKVFETSNLDTKKIQENLLLSYSAHNPTFAELYHQIYTNPMVFKSKSKKIRCGLPTSIPVKWMGNPSLSQYKGISLALHLIGGPQVLLYMFARVIELNGKPEEQACALKLLFNLTFTDIRLYSMFYHEKIDSMLEFVFDSPKCKVSLDVIKTFLDAACNSPLLIKTNRDFQLDGKSHATIIQPSLLVTLLRICKEIIPPKSKKNDKTPIRNKSVNNMTSLCFDDDSDLLETLFYTLEVLIRDDHPLRAFNVFQMNRINFVENLLIFCKERFLSTNLESLSETTSHILVELIRSLMGSPPVLRHIAQLTDFLILMHKDSSTFITHSRTNFYFLLTPIIQTQSSSLSEILGLMPYDIVKKNIKKSLRNNLENSLRKTSAGIKNLNLKLKNRTMDNINQHKHKASLGESYDFLSNESQSESLQIRNSPGTSSENSKKRKSFVMMRIKQKNLKKGKRRRERMKFKSTDELKCTNKTDKDTNIFFNDINLMELPPNTSFPSMNEYVVIESDDADKKITNNCSPTICPEIAIPTLRLNLRTGSVQSQTICEGLLLLLGDTILLMPDSLINQIFGIVVRSELFLILSNHPSTSVRTSVVNVVCSLIQRCTMERLKILENIHYFYHLANQISQNPASIDLVSACASLINGARLTLEDHLKVETWCDVTESGISRSPPLISLLLCILHDTELAKKTLILLSYIIDKGTIKILNDISFCEVVLKTLRKIAVNHHENLEKYDEIIESLNSLLIKMYRKFLQQNNIQLVTDLYNQLSYIELNITSDEISHYNVVKLTRNTHCRLLDLELDYIESQLNITDSNKSGAFNNPHQVTSSSESDGIYNIYTPVKSFLNSSNAKVGKSSRSELINRHVFLLSKSSIFLMSKDVNSGTCAIELNLTRKIFLLLIQILSSICLQSQNKRWQAYRSAEISNITNSFFTWIMAPSSLSTVDKNFFLEAIKESLPIIKQILTPNDLRLQRKLAVYLAHALENISSNCNDEKTLKGFISQWIIEIQPVECRLTLDALAEETLCLIESDKEEIEKIRSRTYPNIKKTIFNKDNLANALTESAMSITRSVVDMQNSERKLFLDHLRHQQNIFLLNIQKWQRLIETLCHEKGVWFFEDSYPKAWEADSIEGPDRIRVRLKRCHLDIDKKFVKPDFQYKTESCLRLTPLSFLFDYNKAINEGKFSGKFLINECVKYTSTAVYITVNREMPGEIILSDRYIHFIPNDDKGNQALIGDCWALESIVSIVTRRWQLRERAIEIFLSSGHTNLIAFDSSCEMESFLCVLDECHLPNRYDIDSFVECMDLWRNGSMTNWKYLMSLNGLAGRSYNDLMQYPVFPFIIADYTSAVLNLNTSTTFRNLHKPIAIQHQFNEIHFIHQYKELKEASINQEPYHFGSHYSNSGSILHYLVRLPPFTKLFLKYQDKSFDMPDRTFHSLLTTWKLSSCDSTSDVKELIPEFFYLPRILCNTEGLNFGVRQCGIPVDDVQLPQWTTDARLFVLIHRQALESSYVKENLPHWIDLIFGYKQTGQAAIDAVNVFHPATYHGFFPTTNADVLDKSAWEDMVRNYGQTPRQLLKQPHPQCITDLSHNPESSIDVLSNVTGLRWGRYCGSPQEPLPNIVWRQKQSTPVIRLIPLLTNEVIGVSSHSTLIVTYTKTRNNLSLINTSIGTLGLVTWGHPDNIVRIKQRKDSPPEPLINIDNVDPLCVVSHATCSTLGALWLGLYSGRIIVVIPAPIDSMPQLIKFSRYPVYLYGHNTPIVSIYVSGSFGVAATASSDGLIIIWDNHDLTYIRSIVNNYATISNICISETLCDVATVHIWLHNKVLNKTSKPNADLKTNESNKKPSLRKISCEEFVGESPECDVGCNNSEGIHKTKYKSRILVHTINGVFVGEAKISDKVTSICYSNAAEGISVNAIVVGLQSGAIRLFSSWDLKPLISLIPTIYTHPIISVIYSIDSQYLYAAASDGTVMIWEGVNNSASAPPNFRIITSSSII